MINEFRPMNHLTSLQNLICTIGNLPTSYVLSLSYEEQIWWLCNFLENKVFPAIEENTNITEETQASFIELQNYVKDYFNNLDVQDEINNKLDEMVEDGVFANILLNYANVTKVYNTHQDLLNDTLIVPNQKVKTLGYHTINDGGGAEYYITDINFNQYKEELSNNLYALLIEKNVYPEMLGAYGDGEHNDQIPFETLISNFNEMFLFKKTYKITSLTFTKDFIIYGNNATIKGDTNVDNLIQMTTQSSNKKLEIYNLIIDASYSNVGIYINQNKLVGEHIKVSNALLIDIQIVKTGSYGVCELNYIDCQLSEVGIQLNATDCKISNYHGYNCLTHIKVRGGLTHINNCHGWNFNSQTRDWITGSALIDTNSSIIGNDIYIDTLENGIILPNDKPYTSVILQNVSYFVNRSSYPATQQPPTLLKNVENYKGYCRIDGFYGDDNGWHDENNNYPVLIDNIDLSKISITNVTNSGFRFNRYKPIETNADIKISSYTLDVDTYVNFGTRKLKMKDYDIHAYMIGYMKTSCPNNTILHQMTFTDQQLNNLSRKTRVTAKFVSTSEEGVIYDLPASIDDNAKLTIYNNTGISLGSQGHYGTVFVYIDDFNQN